MTIFDYQMSAFISREDYSFYAIIMAAMRKADSDNLELLQLAFPHVWEELNARYNAPGGLLDTDVLPMR